MKVLLKSFHLNGHTLGFVGLHKKQYYKKFRWHASVKVRATLVITIYKIITSVDSFH